MGAVTFDAVGPSSAGAFVATNSVLSWAHTCTGADRALLVGVSVGDGTLDSMTAAATYNLVAMTSLGKIHQNNDIFGYTELFGLIGPATGANTVEVTLSAAAASIVAGSTSFNGAGSFGVAVPAAGNSATASAAVTGTAATSMVVDAVGTGASVTTSTTTLRWLKNLNTNTSGGNAAGSTAAGGGTVTMSYTVGSDYWGIVAVEVIAVPDAAMPPRIVTPVQAPHRAASW